MYDFSFFRANLDAIAERLAARGFVLDTAQFRQLDVERRQAITESEQLKERKNARSNEIGKLKREGVDTPAVQQQVRAMGERIAELGQKAKTLGLQFHPMRAG